MIISLSGDLGSGKSTIAKRISEELKIPRFYAGQFFRELAKERGITTIELCELGKKDPSIDKATDAKVKEIADKLSDFLVESRTAWHFIPDSIKVYFKVNSKEGARRILKEFQENDFRKNEDVEMKTVESVELSNKKRMASDIERYKQYYDIDISNMENYDIIIDTTDLSREEVFDETIKMLRLDKRFNK